MAVHKYREQRYSLKDVVIKPSARNETQPYYPTKSIIIRVSVLVLFLPIIFSMLAQLGGVIVLAVLTVVVLGTMGYLVLSVFS